MPQTPESPKDYIESLPHDRKPAIKAIRTTIRKHLPKGYAEGIQYGMLGYFVPHSRYPLGYHCDPKQPLPFVSVASQKHHIGLYLFCAYMDPALQEWFVDAWKASGRTLDMGKSCVRVKDLEGVPLDVLGELVSRCPVDAFVEQYEASLPEAVRAKRASIAERQQEGAKGGPDRARTQAKKLAKRLAAPSSKKTARPSATAEKSGAKKAANKKAPSKQPQSRKRSPSKR